MNYQWRILFVVLLVSCKSDADKMHDLETAKSFATLTVLMYEQRLDSVYPGWSVAHPRIVSTEPKGDADTKYRQLKAFDVKGFLSHPYTDSLMRATERLKLADRDIDRFMR